MSTALWSWLQADPYLLLFPLIVVEGPLATLLAGALVAAGAMTLPLAAALAVAAELTADAAVFTAGRLSRGPRAHARLTRFGLTAARRGALEVAVTRNLPGLLAGAKVADAAAVPVILAAGASGVGYARFLAWSAALSIPKALLLLALGAAFGTRVSSLLTPGATAGLALAALAAFVTVTTVRRRRATRARSTSTTPQPTTTRQPEGARS